MIIIFHETEVYKTLWLVAPSTENMSLNEVFEFIFKSIELPRISLIFALVSKVINCHI